MIFSIKYQAIRQIETKGHNTAMNLLQVTCYFLPASCKRNFQKCFCIPVVISSLVEKAMFKDQMAGFSTLYLLKRKTNQKTKTNKQNQNKQTKKQQQKPNQNPTPTPPTNTNTLDETRTSHLSC